MFHFSRVRFAALFFVVPLFISCGYNDFQRLDENINASWSEVLNQYQRRADLIPNLVSTVKGFAAQEKEVLLGVSQARASVGGVKATPELLNDPQAFKLFLQNQQRLSSAIARLMVVAERYPDLKSNTLFLDLQSQLEGTENRATVARNRYIETIRQYNVLIRSFPTNLTAMVAGYETKPQFQVENEKEISTTPKVSF